MSNFSIPPIGQTSPSSGSTPSPQDEMMEELQQLGISLNDPTTSQNEKQQIVEKILQNMQSTLKNHAGSFSTQAKSLIQECMTQAPQYVNSYNIQDNLNTAMKMLS